MTIDLKSNYVKLHCDEIVNYKISSIIYDNRILDHFTEISNIITPWVILKFTNNVELALWYDENNYEDIDYPSLMCHSAHIAKPPDWMEISDENIIVQNFLRPLKIVNAELKTDEYKCDDVGVVFYDGLDIMLNDDSLININHSSLLSYHIELGYVNFSRKLVDLT